MSEDLNDLIKEINDTKSLTGIIDPLSVKLDKEREVVNDDNLDEFIFSKAASVIQDGVEIIKGLNTTISNNAVDADTISSYSKLIASVSSSIEVLNKINLQKRKAVAAKEIKQLELQHNKESDSLSIKNQTNIIVATREEVMQALINKASDLMSKKEPIDVTAE